MKLAAPGTSTGKTGTPTVQPACTAVTVTVNAVDANWNRVTSVTDMIAITSTDLNAALPANAPSVGGTQTFSADAEDGGYPDDHGDRCHSREPSARRSAPGSALSAGSRCVKLQLLCSGETAAPGTSTGKT